MKRYADWCRKRGATMQCNPVMLIPIAIIAIAITGYIYREVIFTTLLLAVLAVASLAFATGCIALTVNTFRWYRNRAAQARTAEAKAHGTLAAEPVATDDAEADITAEADWLASGVELAWSPDGKTLRAK
jgi:hypothetical protein